MRIFHGPQNIGGMAGVLARAQRELGHDARAVPGFGSHCAFVAQKKPAMNRQPDEIQHQKGQR